MMVTLNLHNSEVSNLAVPDPMVTSQLCAPVPTGTPSASRQQPTVRDHVGDMYGGEPAGWANVEWISRRMHDHIHFVSLAA